MITPCGSEANCVEVVGDDGGVYIRSTKHPETSIFVTSEEWSAFVTAAKDGLFDTVLV